MYQIISESAEFRRRCDEKDLDTGLFFIEIRRILSSICCTNIIVSTDPFWRATNSVGGLIRNQMKLVQYKTTKRTRMLTVSFEHRLLEGRCGRWGGSVWRSWRTSSRLRRPLFRFRQSTQRQIQRSRGCDVTGSYVIARGHAQVDSAAAVDVHTCDSR